MNEDSADFILEYLQDKGASYAEVRLESHEINSFLLKNGTLEVSGFDNIKGIGARFIFNNTLGFLSINDFSKGKIKEFLDKSISITRNSAKITNNVSLSKEKIIRAKEVVKQKIAFKDVNPEEKIRVLTEIENSLTNLGIKIPSRYLNFSDDLSKKYYINSEGSRIFSEIPRIGFWYLFLIQEGNKSMQRYWNHGAAKGFEAVKEWNLAETLSKEAEALHKNLKNAVKAPKEVIDVVTGPEITGIMVHESVGHPYEADRIYGREAAQAGESFVNEEMIGEKIGSEVITVVDDPLVEGSYGYYKYDDEGVEARRKVLIENGKIKEFLHNRETAAYMKLRSNGSSRADNFDKEPMVRMSNTFVLPSKMKFDELIEDIKKGVYMKNFMEWNIDDKRYQQKYVGCEAYLIENGRITKPVYQPILEITTPKLWKSVDAVANNIEFHSGNCGKGEPLAALPVWFGGPSLRLKGIKLGG